MTRSDLIFQIGELRNPIGDRLRCDYPSIVNRAVKIVAERRNWSFMKDLVTATIAANTTAIALPADFKALAPERSPVSYNLPGSTIPIPVHVTSREEANRYGAGYSALYGPIPASYYQAQYVFLEATGPGEGWTLNVPVQFRPTSALSFNVSAFFYPAALVAGDDENAMTTHGLLTDALINLAKAMAYDSETPGDPRAAACKENYETYFRQAASNDARQLLSGRSLHL